MNIVGTGQDGFSVLFETTQDILLCGIAIFLPHAQENRQKYEKLKIFLSLRQHGVSQIGVHGPEIASICHGLSKTEVVEWSGPKGCSKCAGSKSSLLCLPGKIRAYFLLVTFPTINFHIFCTFVKRSLDEQWRSQPNFQAIFWVQRNSSLPFVFLIFPAVNLRSKVLAFTPATF